MGDSEVRFILADCARQHALGVGHVGLLLVEL